MARSAAARSAASAAGRAAAPGWEAGTGAPLAASASSVVRVEEAVAGSAEEGAAMARRRAEVRAGREAVEETAGAEEERKWEFA